MSLLHDISISKEIEVDKSHIENFCLESDKGTKKLRQKFHKNAVIERNKYVEKQRKIFNNYSKRVYFELDGRVNRLLPIDNEKMFEEMYKTIDNYEDLVIGINDKLSVGVKMGLDLLISSITDTVSLRELNECLKLFISKFSSASITLTSEDFDYSMFTKTYMDMYFENCSNDNFMNTASVCFEKVYFECPKIIMHLRMCLRNIINKYDNQLAQYMKEKVEQTLSDKKIDKNEIIPLYLKSRTELMWARRKDPFRNLSVFLNKEEIIADYIPGSFTYEKKFSTFTLGGSYAALSDIEKNKFNSVIKDFYGVVNELKEYYRYEVILKDLIKKYKEKDNSKSLFEQKTKEVSESEKNRLKILKEYYKSGKPHLFGFGSKDMTKVSKLHINEELVKLNQLYNELESVAFNYKMASTLDDASSLYDIFASSLLSFDYLEKSFIENFGSEEDFTLEGEFRRYIKFLFSAFNDFLRKVNGLADYDISEVLADKYKILGLNVSVEDISREKIDMTRETLNYIIRSLCIEENNLNSVKINYICKIKDIKPLDDWEIVNEEII